MIELQNLSKIYANDVQALANINLKVNAGEIFGIIGKSGAGKSTLIRCINLLERPSQGKVIVDGQELTSHSISQLRIARAQMGMIFQHFNLLNSATVYQNIALPLQLNKKKAVQEAVLPLLQLTGLSERSHHYPKQLSGGQKQRVAIARALACQPKVLLCDEATSALDPHTTSAILQLLKTINQQLGLTILLITHDMEVIKSICDKVAVLENGHIIEQAATAQFISQPQSPAAKEFVRSILRTDLPVSLQKQLLKESAPQTYPIWRIWFYGQTSYEPLTSHLIQSLKIELNILQANLEYVQGELIGIMLVEARADSLMLDQGLAYIQARGLRVEVLGYAKRHS
jgi:D-methionine transport system ATP-binding protein